MITIHAWQWDTDIPVCIPYAGTTAPELDFMPDTGTGQTVTPTLSGNTLTAQCPPQLLKSSRPIQIYARLGNTIDRVGMICIRPRPKPPDYIDTPEAVRTWEELAERITQLEEDQASGGITEETDPTVPGWAKNPTKPPYTAAEVGALPDTTKNLPNPCALTITGAVNAVYDGIAPVTVEIPQGGGSGGGAFTYMRTITTEDATYITVNEDANGNPWRFTEAFVAVTTARQASTSASTYAIGLTDWFASFNGKAFVHNIALNPDAYRMMFHVKVADGMLETHVAENLRVANNIGNAKPYANSETRMGRIGSIGWNSAGAYRFCPVESAFAVAQQVGYPMVIDGKLHTITVGNDGVSATPLASGTIVEVWYR